MPNIERRSFLGLAMAAWPLAVLGQAAKSTTPASATFVPAGEDRSKEKHVIGVSSTAFKISTADTNGGLFLFEHTNHGKKGGPPRHLHHHEEEWFYVIEGDYIAEVGSERFHLKPGDSVLAPREVPHAWAFVGNTPGRLLVGFIPANKMEAFFVDNEKRRQDGHYVDDPAVFRAYGMELLGPPLTVE